MSPPASSTSTPLAAPGSPPTGFAALVASASPLAAWGALRRGLELRALEPEDLRANGDEPCLLEAKEILEGLQASRVLTTLAAEALLQLARRGGSAATAGRAPQSGDSQRTYAPALQGDEPEPTFAPARDRGGEPTFAPARGGDREATFAPARDRGDEATFAPTWDRGGEATLAPLFGPGRGLELDGATCAPGGDTSVWPLSPTLASDSERIHEDLAELSPQLRRALLEACARRIALKRGYISRSAPPAPFADAAATPEAALVGARAISGTQAREILLARLQPRSVCQHCLTLLPDAQLLQDPCSGCGRTWPPAARFGEVLTRRSDLEGFPGVGERFGGYEILERLAEGGMGVIFKALQPSLNRIVALKVMRGGRLASDSGRRRFLLEAEAAAGLKHPGIVPVHEVAEIGGYPYYTMDLIEGSSLASLKSVGDTKRVAAVLRQVALAVQHFHQHGLIHRDLKPDNILVDQHDAPRIIDFGIAKKLSGDDSHGTIEGELLGTLHYMSPEQAAGRISEVDTRTDIYALGSILYELLSGQAPFADLGQGSLLLAIQQDEPQALRRLAPSVDRDLISIVAKAMAKEPERRYQTAGEFAEDLERYCEDRPIMARAPSFGYLALKAARRNRVGVTAIALTLVFLALLGAMWANATVKRRASIAELMAVGGDAARSPGERETALVRVLSMDPTQGSAQAQLDLIVARRDAKTAIEGERARQMRAELARARAEREADAIRARERAREEALVQAARKAEQSARALLEEASGEANELTAIRLLSKAQAVVPSSAAELGGEIARLKLNLTIHQTEAALSARQSGLAEFWLQGALQLEVADERRLELEALGQRLTRLRAGAVDLQQARALAAGGEWSAARARFLQARERGVDASLVEGELAVVQEKCEQRALQLLVDGRGDLAAGDPAQALAHAAEVLTLTPGPQGEALFADAEAQLVQDTRREVCRLVFVGERGRALELLERGAHQVKTEALAELLRVERAARARLADDPRLVGLVLVPALPARGLAAPRLLQRHEVTNAEFAEFVAAGGYTQPAPWDAEVRERLDSFRDGCPGEACGHRAPRSWIGGGFGDRENARRPVHGVTVYEARAYARWLSAREGATYRLPTAAEWEVAAAWDLGGQGPVYPWGSAFDPAALPLETGVPEFAASGTPTPLGLVGLGGNVREWVETPTGAATKGADHRCDARSARHYAQVLVTGRTGPAPSDALTLRIGFRLIRELEETR